MALFARAHQKCDSNYNSCNPSVLCCYIGAQVLYEAVKSLEEVGAGSPALRAALLRGVGVHHSGLDTKFRQAVEMLFRSKNLQVNGTLREIQQLVTLGPWQLLCIADCV